MHSIQLYYKSVPHKLGNGHLEKKNIKTNALKLSHSEFLAWEKNALQYCYQVYY